MGEPSAGRVGKRMSPKPDEPEPSDCSEPKQTAQVKRKKIRKPRYAIPKVAFRRLVEEIASRYKSDLRFQPEGIDALQESAETLLAQHFERCAHVAGLCKVDTIRKEHWCFARDGETATLLG